MNLSQATEVMTQPSMYDYGDKVDAYHCFIVEKMKLDKYFSQFLEEHENEMSEDNYSSPAWKQYKVMLKEYETIQRYVNTSRYYITRNNV